VFLKDTPFSLSGLDGRKPYSGILAVNEENSRKHYLDNV
jgi:hypothetical protein